MGDDVGQSSCGGIWASIYNKENGMSIAEDMKKKGVAWTKANKKAGSRIQGLELIRSKLKASLKPFQEEPGLYIFDNCVHLIRTLPTLPRSEYNSEDIDTNAEDHAYDALRYRILKRGVAVKVQQM